MSDDQFTKLDNDVQQLSQSVDQRFEAMDKKFDDQFTKLFKYMERRFSAVDQRFEVMEQKFDGLMSNMDAFIKRLEINDHERLALGRQASRHEKWHHQTAKAVGIKLSI